MTIPPLNTSLSTTQDISIDSLGSNKTLTEDQKIAEASRQFEAILLRNILQNAQKTSFAPKKNAVSTIYSDMVTTNLADAISRSHSLGISQTVQRDLTQTERIKAKD